MGKGRDFYARLQERCRPLVLRLLLQGLDRQAPEEFACLLEHLKMRNLFEAAITSHELRTRFPSTKGKKDTIAEALACIMVTEFDTFQADYMIPPDGETYLIQKLKEYIS